MKFTSRLSLMFLFVGLLFALPLIIAAQENEKELMQTFIELSENRSASEHILASLPSEKRANLHRLNLALSLTGRKDLTAEQRNLLIEAIARFDPTRHEPTKELSIDKIGLNKELSRLFSRNDQTRIFNSVGVQDENEIARLKNTMAIMGLSNEKDRKSVLAGQLPSSRKEFWKNKLALNMASETFTQDQYGMFLEGLVLLDNEFLYANPANKEYQSALDAFAKKSFGVFLKENSYRIFMSPGGDRSCKSMDEKGSKPPPTLDRPAVCNCAYAASCGFISTCGGNCDGGGTTCGVFGGSNCDGLCGQL